jgi:hypothetical protein
MTDFEVFLDRVKKYAKAYDQLEEIQKDEAFDFVPIGDQKTGVIGEAFIFKYLYLKRRKHPGLQFGGAAQKAWDMKYSAPNNMVFVQVKTVSAFSKTKRISPIHLVPDYCELYLVSLNKQLIPDNVWKPGGYAKGKIKVRGGEKVVIGTRMPKDENDTASGFTGIESIFEDFKKAFPEIY